MPANVGENIKQYRKQNRMSQEQLAKIIDVTPQTIHKYETGAVQNIPPQNLLKIAQALRTDPNSILGYNDVNVETNNGVVTLHAENVTNHNTTNIFRELSESAQELLRIYESLNIRRQAQLLKYAYDLEDENKKKE